jgi:hypothetical protein
MALEAAGKLAEWGLVVFWYSERVQSFEAIRDALMALSLIWTASASEHRLPQVQHNFCCDVSRALSRSLSGPLPVFVILV